MVNIFPKFSMNSVRNMALFMRRRIPTHLSPTGLLREKNYTLSDLVNVMLDTAGLSKAWWWEALLTACYVLNIVPNKNKE